MATIVTTGARVIPKRLEELGYQFRTPELEPALRAAVAS
jgi:NAD dependent epimerase/dehydratase family enzyme